MQIKKKSSIKIAFFHIMAANFSGAAKNIFRLLNKIDSKKLDPILVGQTENELTYRVRKLNIKVSIIVYPRALNIYDKKLLNINLLGSIKIFSALWEYNTLLIKYFRLVKPQIIWADNIRTFLFIFFASKLCGCKIIWNIWSEPTGKIAWLLHRVGLVLADTINIEYKAQGQKIFGKLSSLKFFKKKIIPLYTGVTDFEDFFGSDIRKELRLSTDDTLILMAANISPQKGQLDLLKAVQIIIDKYPTLHLLLAGSPLESHSDSIAYHKKLKQFVLDNNIDNNIHFLGWRSDMPDLYRDIDIVVSTSYSESFPDNLRESMLVGKPIIGTNVGGTAELIIEGQNGFICEPGDIKTLIRHIEYLMENSDSRESMGRQGKLTIEKYFSTELYARNFEKMVLKSLR